MIPPLIPLPASKPNNHDDKEDLFATLFTPSTPRASPTLRPVQDDDLAQALRPLRHTRTASVDSEFGAFVSVSSAEDPLGPPTVEGVQSVSLSPLQNLDFFDRFTEDAKAATERNKKEVLDELLEHEDDPLYFLHADSAAAGFQPRSSTSTPIEPSSQQSLIDLSPTDEFWSAKPVPAADIVHLQASVAESKEGRQSRHPTRHGNRTEPTHPPSISRRTSLPPSPIRASHPELHSAQPITASSSFTPSTFPTKWVSSLLSRPSQRRTASVDDAEAHSTIDKPSPPQTTSMISRIQSTVLDASVSITHGTPFASDTYIPPSGAPGFSGDRTWNTGGFEFDKDRVEKKSVRLVGRREMTTPVLTAEVADLIRPNFPALSRLPRSWNLLYSLDQHGISLNTLYARCDSHKGGAVVVMQDSENALFGAWVGEGIHHSNGSYYGGGESFLWKALPGGHLQVFKWTGKNDYVALCEPDYISFGGGDGHYGLYLDDTLIDGSSAPCPTFNNEPLCSDGPRQGENVTFECVGLEVWGVG
ncbi:TLD-domain-containing protein [Cristinia sonorae]|uniref:Oxidation resistance protein 1 n=1 Tax=Cristinia sonorae TaxID=1940300 RepID=A0A8K0UI83_9AGAR|nr:TLD-domain-containing protein [Cristinia sonorae]